MVDRPGKASRGLSRPERLQGHRACVGLRESSLADLGASWMQPGRLWQQPVWGTAPGWGTRVCGDFWVAGEARVWVRHA